MTTDEQLADIMCRIDDAGNHFAIVAAIGRPGRWHVNRNDWDGSTYSGAYRVLSDVSLDEAKQYVASAAYEAAE